MHFHVPKPLHGWRQFAGEVGIIVVGVLIALTAEQMVEWAGWQHKVRSTEQAIRRDLALTADVASERVAVHRCLEDRLNLLRAYLEHPGRPLLLAPQASGFPMAETYEAPGRVWNSELWDGMLADGTLEHLDGERARALNLLYLTVRSAQAANRAEGEEAPLLWFLHDSIELSPDKRIELLQHISMLKKRNEDLYRLSTMVLRRMSDLGELPPLIDTMKRLDGQYSHAMECQYAESDLQKRISKGWFALHR